MKIMIIEQQIIKQDEITLKQHELTTQINSFDTTQLTVFNSFLTTLAFFSKKKCILCLRWTSHSSHSHFIIFL